MKCLVGPCKNEVGGGLCTPCFQRLPFSLRKLLAGATETRPALLRTAARLLEEHQDVKPFRSPRPASR